ncbi:putative RNA methyltransferase [Salinicola halophyticus]|uniref:putative RNA methyltransferase n=1 Tax=Salinicola halophyticus TaxID=1808881 RepID=UPI003F44E987
MSFLPFSALACPLDGDPMHREGQTWRCAAGHSYDIAKQGYTHLLPVQHKRSRDPGDSKEMVAARQRFLDTGHYQPIADAVSRMALADLPAAEVGAEREAVHCLDAGCGDGYYLRQLADAGPQETPFALLGLDISKWAVLSAAKQERSTSQSRASWVVASNAKLPVQGGVLDRVLCLFGFPVYPEFVRALKPGGQLLQADAGPDHLRELREIIYPSLKPERERSEVAPDGLVRRGVETIRYATTLDNVETIVDLLAMTPHLYRASTEGRARVEALDSLTVTVDVRLTRFERLPESD